MQTIFQFINQTTVLVAIGAAAAAVFLYTRWNSQEKVKRFALEVGLTFSTGADDLVHPSGPNSPQASGSNVLTAFLRLVADWKLSGNFNGVEIQVYKVLSEGHDKKEKSTYLKALYKKPKSYGMHIFQRHAPTFADKVLAKFSRDSLPELQTGNQLFDEKVVVKGNDGAGLRSFLANTSVQNQILRVLESDAGITLSDEGAQAIRPGRFADPAQIRTILTLLTETVRELESAS